MFSTWYGRRHLEGDDKLVQFVYRLGMVRLGRVRSG